MRKLILLPIFSAMLLGCNTNEPKANQNTHWTTSTGDSTRVESNQYPSDNTGTNVRDLDSSQEVPFDQGESKSDRILTKLIRQKLMEDASLSTDAKNIKIITINGMVTLRGPVDSSQEKEIVIKKVRMISGIKDVNDKTDVITK